MLHAVRGSLAFVAAARMVLIAVEEPGTGADCCCPSKNNLGALAFSKDEMTDAAPGELPLNAGVPSVPNLRSSSAFRRSRSKGGIEDGAVMHASYFS